MKLDLSQIFDGTIYKLDLDENLNINASDIELENPVNITGSIYATEDGVYLNANLTYEYIENCARCLTEFSYKEENVLSAKIIEKSDQQAEEKADEDEIIVYYDDNNNNLEIEDTILTSIVLNRPMKSICSESCKGLCTKCGVDLNDKSCECTHEDIDPRLEKLKNLFD